MASFFSPMNGCLKFNRNISFKSGLAPVLQKTWGGVGAKNSIQSSFSDCKQVW